MRRPSRSPRLVSVCLAGTTAKSVSDNKRRIDLLAEVIETITTHVAWHPIDAVIFPGGLFRLDTPIGRKPFEERAKAIASRPFSSAVIKAASALDEQMKGALVVFGMFAESRGAKERDDQACVAVNSKGVVGLSRKIFPVDSDTDGRTYLVQSVADFSSAERFISLPNGSTAVLSACYDLFGLAEDPEKPTVRTRAVRRLWNGKQLVQVGDEGFRALRAECMVSWRQQLADRKPGVAIATIHGFERSGRDGYWQRHGIAAASAALGGGLVVGAANFTHGMPTADKSTLAARRVPRSHLPDALHRPARALQPMDSLQLPAEGETKALIRLFTDLRGRP